MELGQWEKAIDRVKRHTREAKTWATIRTKSQTEVSSSTGKPKVSGSKRLALHHACFKLRSAGAFPMMSEESDPFIQICKFILLLVKLYPDGAGQRETRHGCLPLHLAAFASCAPKEHSPPSPRSFGRGHSPSSGSDRPPIQSPGSSSSFGQTSPAGWKNHKEHRRSASSVGSGSSSLQRPGIISRRIASDATSATTETHLSEIHAQEAYTGGVMMQTAQMETNPFTRTSSSSPSNRLVSVAVKNAIVISAKREEMAVQVINALLDAYPKGIRVDSEGGRLPLHTACAGRATPRVISTLVTAYPSAARHRNKDGFLPLHLAAHWGVSHPNCGISLLKCYPDATVGRNRWERTPLEEALCMSGENGRPHQAALVRALRKHPSYWSRPSDILEHSGSGNSRRNKGPTTVDIDESLASFEDNTTLEERNSYYGHISEEKLDKEFNGNGFFGKLSPKNTQQRKTHDNLDIPLGKLIQHGQWDEVLLRVQTYPLQAELEMEVSTRGGFMASSGFTPLHYACERQPPLEVVQALIAAHPVGVLTRTMPGGALPLHIACTWYASTEVVQALLSADQGACQVTDELGNVALHSACFSGAELGVVESLTAADAQTVLFRNHQGSRPSDVCKRLRHSNRKAVLAQLTLKKEEVLALHRRRSSSGNLDDEAKQAFDANALSSPNATTSQDDKEDSQVDVLQESAAIEVAYATNGSEESDELMW
eukprot:CAMPEP_0172466456 /NCGR_PEP_ID=MMETSP1065-20121228/56179_1 /TAXON_ID=265537 /ORGANISM="Amphiprora paludosa, Strain CCMP125" /LENGTH=711 /DNA_ID=CAMNT_0013223259 /DNA_START=428 /DNA_END=2560 /DNA_ORIENTATION=-